MSTKLFKKIIIELSDIGTCYLYLSGGEPLLVAGIDEWIRFAKKKIPFVHLVTNGYLLDRDMARRLGEAGIDMVSISLDGEEELHDYYRNRKGSYKAALSAVKNMKKYAPGTRTVITSMLSLWNSSGFENLERIVKQCGVSHRITAHVFYPVVDHLKNRDELMGLTPVKAFNELEKYVVKSQKVKFDPFVSMIPDFYKSLIKQDDFDHPVFRSRCPIPLYYTNIMENGEIFPCPGVDSSLYPGTENKRFEFSCKNNRIKPIFFGKAYGAMQNYLVGCQECKRFLASCYVRPRIYFPLGNLFKFYIIPQINNAFRSFSLF